jgi:osmotically-inducible protein OsmY
MTVTDLLEPLELAALERMLSHDDLVRERVVRLLREHELDLAGIDVEVKGGRVSLRGCVADSLTSLLVEDLAWLVPQVHACHNRLQVLRVA